MADIDVCPDRNELERLLLGYIPSHEASTLDEHLLGCERCCALLHDLVTGDSLAGDIRSASAQSLPADERVTAAIARWKEVTLVGKAVEETVVRNPETTEDAWDLAKLLDPPEAEGELGRFGGYRVLRVLGAGGMGLVFEAEDTRLRRRVALKVMKRSLAARDEHHQRFLREARAAAAIEHPHIVTVFQVGEHNGLPFLAMQLLKGESLDDRLRREGARERRSDGETEGRREGEKEGTRGRASQQAEGGAPVAPSLHRSLSPSPLPLAECLRIGRETAEALAEAHRRNLIHRDIKPGNIWLEGASGWVKLVDFGLAHAGEDVHLTQTGAILGTPAYMSPEQARGEAVDGRTDLYSLGAVLYKLTTGDVPLRGTSTMAVLMSLATETPRPPIELNPDVPLALNDLIMRLLAKKPSERFDSAAEVVEAIRAIEQESPKSKVQSPKSDGDAGRRRPRWPLVAAAAAAFVLAAIVIIVRDKDGNEVGRMAVPPGGSAAAEESQASGVASGRREPPGKVEPALHDGSASRPPAGRPDSPPRSVGATLSEPPPLEEWLKGREALTVAQDGSGQFNSIKEALEALLPGQVVKVLDGGPYRVSLNLESLPADVGLVSNRQTVLEISDWIPETEGSQHLAGMHFAYMSGFRLHGFTIVAKKPPYGNQLAFGNCGDVVIEECVIRETGPDHGKEAGAAVNFQWFEGPGTSGPVWVRDSAIECLVRIGHGDARTGVTLVRNYLHRRGPSEDLKFLLQAGDHAGMLAMRDNILDARGKALVVSWSPGARGPLVMVNNSIFSAGNTLWGSQLPRDGVIINNLFEVGCQLRPDMAAAATAKDWRLGPNAYLSEPAFNELPRSQRDVKGPAKFISNDFASADYRRPQADSPFATAGAGGELPDYLGALPPGPAPKDGDWFTRIQQRWQRADAAIDALRSPQSADIRPTAGIPEPPPLEGWLKDREALTVAQDGSGQFKTIQAALDALQPGHVVKVLDRGPYRERLEMEDVPADTGLVSDKGTVLELAAYAPKYKVGDVQYYIGHLFQGMEGFRIAGFTFQFPAPDKEGLFGRICGRFSPVSG